MNRPFSEPGWPEEADKNPRRIWLDHVRNLYHILDELRQRHPNVAFESCSSGGGRVDLGILFHLLSGSNFLYCHKKLLLLSTPTFLKVAR
jgi:alpha-galactosidase